MKIMHILSAPAAGGAEVYVKDLSIAMVERGHKVEILFVNRAEDVGRDATYERGFLRDLDVGGVQYGFIGYRSRKNLLFGVRRLRKYVREWRPDIIHAHLYFGALFAFFSRVPLVYTHHNILLRVAPLFYRWFLDFRVSQYVGICHACCQILLKATNKPVVRIDNAVNPSRIQSDKKFDFGAVDELKLLAVGGLTEQKNYRLMIDAVAKLEGLEFKLLIAGEGEKREALLRYCRELGLSERVAFLGNVSDMAALYKGVDVFVMSSSWEGLPIALIEATLAGLPVVVTNVGGCAEVVHHACNGIVIDGFEAEDFADGLRRVLVSNDLRKSFSKNAIECSSRYHLVNAVDNHLKMYRKMQGK